MALPSPTVDRWGKRYAAYLFDLDGTLVDTAPDIHAALNVALLDFGFETVTLAETRDWVGQGARRLIHRAGSAQRLADGASFQDTELVPEKDLPLDAMQARFLAHYASAISTYSEPFPEMRETLTALKRDGAELAVVTNKPEGLARALLDDLDLSSLFGAIVGADTTAETKPSALPAQFALDQLARPIDPQDVLFVGDSAADVGCARALRCAVAVVSFGYTQGTDPAALGGDAVIDSFSALL
ncbi:MAG: HAD-IA family hydrolase [Pseudomonadota bacterium]